MRLAMLLVVIAATAGVARADTLDGIEKAAPTCDAARKYCFEIVLHVAQDENGLVTDGAFVATELGIANKHFAALDVGFQLARVEAFTPTSTRVETRKDRDAFGRGTLAAGVLHVFVVGQLDDIDNAGDLLNGVTWKRGDGSKFVILSNTAFERTLAHELGHVFGLPHSDYPISIMNKTKRDEPPVEQRTFADEEIASMRGQLKRLVRSKLLVPRKPKTS